MLLCSSLSAFGCGGNNGGSEKLPAVKAATDVTFKETDIDLVKDGATPYSIVVPQSAPSMVTFAASELKNLFLKSTGISLNIVTENSEMTTEGYYFSLGNTILQQESGINPPSTGKRNPFFIFQTDEPPLGEEGAFAIERKDNTLIMVGIDDFGTVFAVYEFLEKQLGYEYYAADEIVIDNVKEAKLLDFKWSYTPYAMRNHVTDLMSSYEAGLRYRMIKRENELYYPHSWLTVIPFSVYGKDHPEWFGAGGQALCLSNEEMAKEFAKNVLEKFDAYGYATMCIGQEDSWAKCGCPACQVNDEKYKPSGTNVRFCNRVAEEVDRLLTEQGRPDFRYRLTMLAYYQYEAPPVVKVGNEWALIDESVKFHDNVGVNLCLFGAADAAAPLTGPGSEINKGALEQIEGWLACDPVALQLYIYRGYFPVYNLAFPFDWSNLKNWIIEAKEHGSISNTWSIWSQSQYEAMRAYVQGQICYDPTQNVEQLMAEFIDVYYKDAAPQLQEFFDEITGYMYMQHAKDPSGFHLPTLSTGAGPLLDNASYWPDNMLKDWLELFDEAYAVLEASDMEKAQKDILKTRIDNESLWPRYWYLRHYGKTHLSTEEYEKQREQVLNDAYRAGYVEAGVRARLYSP